MVHSSGVETGSSGGPVLVVLGSGRQGGSRAAALDALAASHRLAPVGRAPTVEELAAIDPGGVLHLLAVGDAGAVALDVARERPDLVASVIVESPGSRVAECVGRLGGVVVPTLALCGTEADPAVADAGRALRRALPNSALVFVWAAGDDVRGDRPEAFADVVADFVRRGMGFLVEDRPGVINP